MKTKWIFLLGSLYGSAFAQTDSCLKVGPTPEVGLVIQSQCLDKMSEDQALTGGRFNYPARLIKSQGRYYVTAQKVLAYPVTYKNGEQQKEYFERKVTIPVRVTLDKMGLDLLASTAIADSDGEHEGPLDGNESTGYFRVPGDVDATIQDLMASFKGQYGGAAFIFGAAKGKAVSEKRIYLKDWHASMIGPITSHLSLGVGLYGFNILIEQGAEAKISYRHYGNGFVCISENQNCMLKENSKIIPSYKVMHEKI
jgi:hypothetical protein